MVIRVMVRVRVRVRVGVRVSPYLRKMFWMPSESEKDLSLHSFNGMRRSRELCIWRLRIEVVKINLRRKGMSESDKRQRRPAFVYVY